MYKLTLDVCFTEHETVADAIAELTAHTPLTATVETAHGPGGGWPVVRFEADDRAWFGVLAERYSGGDAEDVAYQLSLVEG